MQQSPQAPGPDPRQDLLPGEEPDIRAEIRRVIKNARSWLEEPNDLLAGRRPRDLIGTPDERHLRDLIRSAKHALS